MDITSLIGPAVVAAVISGLVSGIGIWISARTTRAIHTEKLTFDQEQAERRVNAQIALAEKKFAFDKAIVAWRRRYELAEQLLASAFDERDALNWARVPVTISGEGETRAATASETAELRRRRNSAFVPLERLHNSAKIFATLEASRHAATAHFGPATGKAISRIFEVHQSLSSAAALLVEMTHDDDGSSLLPMRKTLWGDRPDENDRKLNTAIEELEVICKSILTGKVPA